MRKCLTPYFIGVEEKGLEDEEWSFDSIIDVPQDIYRQGPLATIQFVNAKLKDFVSDTITKGEKPVVLSGDCLSAIGCIAGVQQAGIDPSLLWFDAHGDFHTPQTTLSGHLGGMPLAMITGRGDRSLIAQVKLQPLPDTKVYLIGGRDLDPGEKEAIEASTLFTYSNSISLWSDLPRDASCWIHFDTDYINPIDAPAMRYPAKGGQLAKVIKFDFHHIPSSIKILGISISAWAPSLDKDYNTAKICLDVLTPLFNSISL